MERIKPRPIHILLKIVIDNFRAHFEDGLCHTFRSMQEWNVINHTECVELDVFLRSHKSTNSKKKKWPYFWEVNRPFPRKAWLWKHYILQSIKFKLENKRGKVF